MRLAVLMSGVLMCGLSLALPNAAADPPGERLTDRMVDAYEQTQQYQARLTLRLEMTEGRWKTTREGEFHVAIDREHERLLIDHPDMYIVVADGTLRMKSPHIAGHYLQTELETLSYASLVDAIGFVADPVLYDVVFLLDENPLRRLTGRSVVSLSSSSVDEQGALGGLLLPTAAGSVVLTLDAQTGLISRTRWQGEEDGDKAVVTYEYEVERLNEPLTEDLFAFDADGMQAVDSMQALLASGQGQSGASAAPRGEQGLVGQPAPAIELPRMGGGSFRLDDVESRVVIVDFWATWCGPCLPGLQALQRVQDWAEESGKSVSIIALNLGETQEQAEGFWNRHGFTMPVVMDADHRVGRAYGVRAIPQTVVIVDGTVRSVHVGAGPNYEQEVRAEIDRFLAEAGD